LLETLARIGEALYAARVWLWAVAGVGLTLFAVELVWSGQSDRYLMGGLLVCAWAAFLLAFGHAFSWMGRRVGPVRGSWLERQLAKLRRALFWSIAGATMAVLGFLVYLSVRLLGMLFSVDNA
jgi:hypothetical protein